MINRSIHVPLNCKYHPWGLINDMQMSIYIIGNTGTHCPIHFFVQHEGDWRPTRPPQQVIRACLHGGGGPQIGEVTRLGGVTRLSIQSLILI